MMSPHENMYTLLLMYKFSLYKRIPKKTNMNIKYILSKCIKPFNKYTLITVFYYDEVES